MKFAEMMTLTESDEFVMEMANFLADVTELPANIVLWTKPQPSELPHNKYRMKIYKDRIHCATYTIGQHPELLWQIPQKRFRLNADEINEIISVIGRYSSLFIQYVDAKLTANETKFEIRKAQGEE